MGSNRPTHTTSEVMYSDQVWNILHCECTIHHCVCCCVCLSVTSDHHRVRVCSIEMIWVTLREHKCDMEGNDSAGNARRRKKKERETWCLNATNEPINSCNVCEMIVKNRYSVCEQLLDRSFSSREKEWFSSHLPATGYFSFIIII